MTDGVADEHWFRRRNIGVRRMSKAIIDGRGY